MNNDPTKLANRVLNSGSCGECGGEPGLTLAQSVIDLHAALVEVCAMNDHLSAKMEPQAVRWARLRIADIRNLFSLPNELPVDDDG